MGDYNPLRSTPIAILLGSVIISLSIMVTNGVLRFDKSPTGQTKVSFIQPTKTQVLGTGTAVGNPPSDVVPQASVEPAKVEVEPMTEKDHIRGNKNARIVLYEYSDLECPFCKRFHPTAKEALAAYPNDLVWVYRHFPLDQLHSKADKEAEAVECANEQQGSEGFWKLTDKIYEVTPTNNGLNLDDLPTLASEVGLDGAKLKTCVDSGKYAQLVEADYQSGIKAGVNGTPGNILLDTKTGKTTVLPGAVPIETLKSSIDSLLAS